MRPIQLLRDGAAAWMISGSHYAVFGGALSRIDLRTGATRVHREILKYLAPTRMLVNPTRPRELCLSTTIHADCGSGIPVEPSAKLMLFDRKSEKLLHAFTPRAGAATLKLLAFTPEGEALYLDAGELWTWTPDTQNVRRIGLAPDGIREILPGPGGQGLWATGRNGIGPLTLGDPCCIDPAIDPAITRAAFDGMGKYLTWEGDTLWFTTGREVLGVAATGAWSDLV